MSNDATSAIGKEPKRRKVFQESDRQILIEAMKHIFPTVPTLPVYFLFKINLLYSKM